MIDMNFGSWDEGPMRVLTQDDVMGGNSSSSAGFNAIDMECNVTDEDDGFGSVNSRFMEPETPDTITMDPVNTTYGFSADFSDDDEPLFEKDGFTANTKRLFVIQNKQGKNISDPNPSSDKLYDEIERKGLEDAVVVPYKPNTEKKPAGKTVITEVEEELLDEKKSKNAIGTVTKDYWSKKASQHSSTNKKGSYNWQFKLDGAKPAGVHERTTLGNPARDAELFNSSVRGGGSTGGNVTGAASGGEGGGCCESYEGNNWNNKFNDMLGIMGFERNGNNIKDTLSPEFIIKCENAQKAIEELKEYIEDFFICPLECRSGKKFDNYGDWCNWYNKEGKDYPQCADNIQYCDLLANHINDVDWKC